MSLDPKKSEVYGGPIKHAATTFEYWERAMLQNPNAPAMIVMHQPREHLAELKKEARETNENGTRGTNHLIWTYRQLYLASFRVANGLLAAGIKPGKSTVVSFMPNGVEYGIFLWASLLLRITISNLDIGALQTQRSAELEGFLRALEPQAIIVPDGAGADAVSAVVTRQNFEDPPIKIIVRDSDADAPLPSGWTGLLELGKMGERTPVIDEATLNQQAKTDDPERIMAVLFTSGTSSGKPKGCPKSVRSMAHVLQGQLWLSESIEHPHVIVQTANFRVIAIAMCSHAWAKGGTVVMPSANFDAVSILDAIDQHNSVVMVLVPYQFHAIVHHTRFSTVNVGNVASLRVGADMITKDLLLKAKDNFPNTTHISAAHGMTEGGAIFHSDDPDVAKLPYHAGIAPLGHVSKGTRLRTVDQETKEVTQRGIVGELHICSHGVIRYYLGNVKQEDFYHDEYGQWFNTGDLGMISENGDVYILGRAKDIIKRAGVPLTPAAIESCIQRNAKTVCSVIAVPHPTLGQEPFAVVQGFGKSSEEQLKKDVVAELGEAFTMAGIASLDQLGLAAFPVNTTGKIVKNELQEPVARYRKSRTGY